MFDEKLLELGYKPSAIRDVYSYGLRRKAEVGEDNVFDFSIGNPSTPAPEIVKETIVRLLNEEDPVEVHGYTESPGKKSIRDEIAKYLNKTYGANVSGDYIYLTCGASASLATVTRAFLNPGDEAIVFAPHFPEHRIYAEAAGAKVIAVKPDQDFLPDFADLESKLNEKTKMVIYDSPNNPTGAFYDEKTIVKLSDILKRKEEEYGHAIYLVSDEPYRELLYIEAKYPFVTNYYRNSVVCYSFSKCLSLPGERIGYVLLNPESDEREDAFAAMRGAARLLGYICAPSLFQHLIPYCLGHTSNLEEYKTNRDALYNALTDIGYEVIYPSGAFYLFVKALEPDANKFEEVAKQYELLLVPSDSFDYPGYVRLAYCVTREMIIRSIPAFQKLFDHYKKQK